ncbi:MAG TPA: hypothetical protein VFU49_03115 [Ktedonobacteraceae bacterium]|nr:hypothetical protein [Ktedonobacteraceae bacterium]
MEHPISLLWLADIDPAKIETLPSLQELRAHGADLRLTPLPLAEKEQCYYQTLTGMGPGKFGRFDAVQAEGYRAVATADIADNARAWRLPDLLKSRKLAVVSEEITGMEGLNTLAAQKFDFALLRLSNAGSLTPDTLDAIVSRYLELVATRGHSFIMTDVWQAAAHTLVNVNDFLVDIGLLEVKGTRCAANIVWPEALVYGLGAGQLWINLRGREPEGVVGSGREYQEVCDALVYELRSNWLDTRTNEPVIEQVYKKSELYGGEYLFKAPDLITVYRPGYAPSARAVALDLDGASITTVGDPGQVQAPYARLLGYGPSLLSSVGQQAALIDVAPTMLYLLGLPIPRRMDGEVVTGIVTQEYQEQHAINRIDEVEHLLTDEEEGLIVDRLRDLGYLG